MSDTRQQPEDRIVFCREIDPDTVLHLSSLGDNYMMRRFDGTDPFTIDEHPAYNDMKVCYHFMFDRPLTTEEGAHPVSDEEYWAVRIVEINAEVLPVLER